jgi:hypothetical protein
LAAHGVWLGVAAWQFLFSGFGKKTPTRAARAFCCFFKETTSV